MMPSSCSIVRPKWSLMSRMPSMMDSKRIMFVGRWLLAVDRWSCASLSANGQRPTVNDSVDTVDQTVHDADAAAGGGGDAGVVGDEDDGLVVRGELLEDVDD